MVLNLFISLVYHHHVAMDALFHVLLAVHTYIYSASTLISPTVPSLDELPGADVPKITEPQWTVAPESCAI